MIDNVYVYVVGTYQDATTNYFGTSLYPKEKSDSSKNTDNTLAAAASTTMVFVAKYGGTTNQDWSKVRVGGGNLEWVKGLGASSTVLSASGVAVDGVSGNVLITGTYQAASLPLTNLFGTGTHYHLLV